MAVDPCFSRAGFLPEAWSIACGIEEAVRGISSPEAAAAGRLLRTLTHRMAGSAAMFGMTEVARLADAMEVAAERLESGEGEREEALTFLAGTLPRLTRLLEEESGPASDPLAAELAELARREPEMLEDFLPEMREHLEEAGEALVRLSAGGGSAEELAGLFRHVHTLKGTAYVVGCRPVGELAHRIEDALAVAREEPARFDARAVRLGLAAVETLQGMAEALAGRPPAGPLSADRDAALRDLAAWTAEAASSRTAPPDSPEPPAAGDSAGPSEPRAPAGLRLRLRAVDDLLQLTGDLLAMRNRLHRDLERAEALRAESRSSVERLRRVIREFGDRYLEPQIAGWSGDGTAPGAELSDLELDRYDDFNILARRLDEIAADLAEVDAQEGALQLDLRGGAEGLKGRVEALHAGVGRLRLVPIGQVFGRCARLARRAAVEAGKELALEVSGDRVEVDAAIAELIWEPMLHLVRNALGHGLETPGERAARGKSPAGRLSLRARAEGRRVVVEVEDDGAGIDPVRVRERARELGLPAEGEALRLIFQPGFSTTAEPTAASGRGVGLDVARSTLERLGGGVEVTSRPGEGTLFRLVFPLTLVVSEALLVRVGEEVVALPATAVERVAEVGPEGVETDGGRVPLVDLARVLGVAPRPADGRSPAVLVGAPGRWRALRVDEVLGSESAVLRPLSSFFAGFDLFGGAVLTREGRLVLLLNPGAAMAAGTGAPEPEALPDPPASRPARVLLADDSLSVRRILGGMLARAGYEVTLAVDGQEAAERLEEGGWDLLLTDLEMPRRNGYELLAWLRQRPATASLPVVVVTSRAGDKHRELARRQGATSYLAKPIEESLLLRTVAGLTRSAGRS